MTLVARLQAYLRHSARQQYEAVPLPPFTLFFHPCDPAIYFNYAIPDGPVTGDVEQLWPRLRTAFTTCGRQPRFEFIEEFAPQLPALLRVASFVEEGHYPLMVCTSESYHPAPEVPGLTVTTVASDSPLLDVQDYVTVQRQGFDPNNMSVATAADAENLRPMLGNGMAFLARLDGQPAGIAMFTSPYDGVTEVVGVATRPAFRRQGIASILTGRAVQASFSQGVTIVCLSAGDERAGRVYERVGFRPYATMLAYGEKQPTP